MAKFNETPLTVAAREVIDEVRAELIKFKRQEGMTNEELGQYMEVSTSTVDLFIRGRQLHGITLVKIVKALGITL
jgi:plasmid maintenance system antidote protein VapI